MARFALLIGLVLALPAWAGEAEWKAHLDAGQAAQRRGAIPAAISELQSALGEAEGFARRDVRLGLTLNELGVAYRSLGRYVDAESTFRRAIAIREYGLGSEHPDVAVTVMHLAMLYRDTGRYAEAEPLFRRCLAIREKALSPEHPDVAATVNAFARHYRMQDRYADAEPLLRRYLALKESALGPGNLDVAAALDHLAELYRAEGRFADAESSYRRSVAIQERALGPEHLDVARSLNNLAALYSDQGRPADAEPLYLRSLAIEERALGAVHADVAATLNNLAELYRVASRYAEAEPLYLRAVAIMEKARSPGHPDIAAFVSNLAVLYRSQGRRVEAAALNLRALTTREAAFGPEHLSVAQSLNNLAVLHVDEEDYAKAEPLLRRALAIREKVLGPEHPDVAQSHSQLAELFSRQGRIAEGLFEARQSSDILGRRFLHAAADGRRGVLSEQQSRSERFELHVQLLARDTAETPNHADADGAEAFQVAQLARASDTSEQIARMAARFSMGSDALAGVARQRQDLLARWATLDALILREVSKPAADRSADGEAKLHEEQAAIQRQVSELDARLSREFPQYRELANPEPLTMEGARKLLGEKEALVVFMATRTESYVWAVDSHAASFRRSPLTRKELEDATRKLRSRLDLKEGAKILREPFDVETSHELYRNLLGPVEEIIERAPSLLIVPDGALESLPPAVLVAALPAHPIREGVPADHGQVEWLVKKHAITILPSVSSLRALRAFAHASLGREPFAGFGNPLLQGSPSDSRAKMAAAVLSRGIVADSAEIRAAFTALPETADELRAIAKTLGAPESALYLGRDATETTVKSIDLTRYRALAFATHGVMAGEFRGSAEPALVLTPPEKGTELDDGLLTSSEIAQLKLNADWVVLSACNTAAPDGTPGAEGFSGLAKAFFYAGARSLLVSHWSVHSEAAEFLTTRTFKEFARGASKAEALRRAMLSLMQREDRPFFAHPAIWAPFVVVGESGATTSLHEELHDP